MRHFNYKNVFTIYFPLFVSWFHYIFLFPFPSDSPVFWDVQLNICAKPSLYFKNSV